MNHGNDVFFNELLRVHLDSPQALGGILEQTCLRMMPFTQFNDTEGSLSLAGHTAGPYDQTAAACALALRAQQAHAFLASDHRASGWEKLTRL